MEENREIAGDNQEIRDEKGRFRPGVSGNPAGKPAGKKSYETEMNEAIEEYAKLNGMTPEQVKIRIYMRGAGEALKGEYSFFRDYMDRVHGKPMQPLGNADGSPLTINIIKYGSDNDTI